MRLKAVMLMDIKLLSAFFGIKSGAQYPGWMGFGAMDRSKPPLFSRQAGISSPALAGFTLTGEKAQC